MQPACCRPVAAQSRRKTQPPNRDHPAPRQEWKSGTTVPGLRRWRAESRVPDVAESVRARPRNMYCLFIFISHHSVCKRLCVGIVLKMPCTNVVPTPHTRHDTDGTSYYTDGARRRRAGESRLRLHTLMKHAAAGRHSRYLTRRTPDTHDSHGTTVHAGSLTRWGAHELHSKSHNNVGSG